MKKFKYIFLLITIFILTGCKKSDNFEKIVKDFTINTFDIFISLEEPNFSLIHPEGENLKNMIESRNKIAYNNLKNNRDDYKDYKSEFKFDEPYSEKDLVYIEYKYFIEKPKDGSGYYPDNAVLLKKDGNDNWKILNAISFHEPWDEMFLSEEDDEYLHRTTLVPEKELSKREKMEKLKNLKYDISEKNIKLLKEQYVDNNTIID